MSHIVKCGFLTALVTSGLAFGEIDRSQSWSDEKIDSGWKTPDAIKERGARSQHEALETWRSDILKSSNLSQYERIGMLGDAVTRISRFNIYQVPERIEVYDLAREKLLSIPGHARYYEEQILEQQKLCGGAALKSGKRNDYDDMRGWAFVTLSHLPSPETVGVLGRMLVDDKDFPTDEMNRPRLGGISMSVPGNPDLAMKALEKIGLRDMPAKQEFPKLDPDGWRSILADPARRDLYPHPLCEQWYEMRGWRLWWDDVKNGRKTFSFKGQSVEYRFKPDGTWETLAMVNAPDDGPKVAGKVERPRGGKTEQVAGEVRREWIWLALPVILAAGIGVWRLAKRFGKVTGAV